MAKRNRGSLAPDRRLIWAQIIHPRDGKTVYIGSDWKTVASKQFNTEYTLRAGYEITERTIDKYGQFVFCKPFLHKIAKSFCRLLHLHFVGNCKTTAGSYSASHKPLQIIFSCYNTRYGNGSSEFSSSCACSLK